jgi:hypothetical protein
MKEEFYVVERRNMNSKSYVEEELQRIGVAVKNNQGEYLPFVYVLASISDKWVILSKEEQDRVSSLFTMG